MSNGRDALKNFVAECDHTVKQIRAARAPKSCGAFDSISSGLVILIRRAALESGRHKPLRLAHRKRSGLKVLACCVIIR